MNRSDGRQWSLASASGRERWVVCADKARPGTWSSSVAGTSALNGADYFGAAIHGLTLDGDAVGGLGEGIASYPGARTPFDVRLSPPPEPELWFSLGARADVISSPERPVAEIRMATGRATTAVTFVVDDTCLAGLADGLGAWLAEPH